MTVRLSVIVPIYGVEEYIDNLLDSLTPNLLQGVEVIMVDDGSKDKCGSIIDEYQKQNSAYVKVIHKKNGGVSSARNAGLKLAKGDYIAWADPDDRIANNYTLTVFDALLKYEEPDMLFFDYYKCNKDTNIVRTADCESGLVDKKSFLENFFSGNFKTYELWHKVIKRQLLKDISFNENIRCGEDVVFFCNVVLKLNTIVYLAMPLYYYDERDGSLTKIEKIEHKRTVFDSFKNTYFECKKVWGIRSIGTVACCAYEALRSEYISGNNMNESNVKEYENFIKANIKDIVFNKDISIGDKRQCIFVWLGLARSYNQRKYKS